MSGWKLKGRVKALEVCSDPRRGAMTWVIVDPGETQEAAIARHVALHGPVAPGGVLLWCSTGVPRGEGATVCA
jgi:hypothetical protein